MFFSPVQLCESYDVIYESDLQVNRLIIPFDDSYGKTEKG